MSMLDLMLAGKGAGSDSAFDGSELSAGLQYSGTAYQGAGQSRLTSDWSAQPHDPNDVWWTESRWIGDRSEDLLRNNGYAVALMETLIQGAIGPCGLKWRSSYQADPLAEESTPADLDMRRLLEAEVANATAGTAFDAGGQLSERDQLVTVFASCIARGDGISVRTWKPARPGPHTHATCWRTIHASRIMNPGFSANIFRPDGSRLFEGFEMDKDGNPVGVHICRRHPYAQLDWKLQWSYVPIWGSDGVRNVVHLKSTRFPDSIRGMGWLAPVLVVLQNLGKTEEAYVLAKRVQSCSIYLMEVDDPAKAAAADSRGAVFGANTKIVPGRVYYVKKGAGIQFLNGNFQGADYAQFSEVLLTNFAASLNLPVAFVLNKLTQGSLASARAALMQAWATFATVQESLICYVKEPWTQSILSESWSRGRIPGIEEQDLPLIYRGHYQRPPRGFPDPVRESQAADTKINKLQISASTVLAEQGYDWEEEQRKRKREKSLLAAEGLDQPPAPPAPPTLNPADLEDDDEEPKKPDQPAGSLYQLEPVGAV
jgi:capsid protein